MRRHFMGRNGFNPTQNQAEFGTPRHSTDDVVYHRGAAYLCGIPTILPGPFHFLGNFGDMNGIKVASSVIPLVDPNEGFKGQVPLSQAPVYPRGNPWEMGGW